MKSFLTIWILSCLCYSISSFSQTTIGSYPIFVSVNKTSNLIFSYAIVSVDRGSPDILAQKAKGTDNVLQLKAAREHFVPTSLCVITSDGKLSSFMVSYADSPQALNILLKSENNDSLKNLSDQQILLTAKKLNDLILYKNAMAVLKQPHFLHGHIYADGIKLALHGIYIKDDLLWFSLEIANKSFLDYRMNFLHCFIQDKTKAARSAVQENDVPVLFPASFSEPTSGKKRKKFVLAFSPFTFSRDKKMIIQISEKNGGRMLSLGISHKTLLKAKGCSVNNL
jgi:conjugative transposon TraN protein